MAKQEIRIENLPSRTSFRRARVLALLPYETK